ncbi:hypothetical protein EVAR_78924_1 [Eumeta japonica]|uniref:Uncharacterized protein n=1 Tax=Eumeta variegata TaxID=151549 RepID=A0A4C1U2G1_EUMVA|nr:hypothetical protein EVAR_78924_1 [Eumeta japonica]
MNFSHGKPSHSRSKLETRLTKLNCSYTGQRKGSSPAMDIHNSSAVSSALPASCVGIEQLMEGNTERAVALSDDVTGKANALLTVTDALDRC